MRFRLYYNLDMPINIRPLKIGTTVLKVFIITLILDLSFIPLFFILKDGHLALFFILLIPAVLVECAIFWTGIFMVYTTSLQLGIRHRVWGIVLGWVPVANIIMLFKIIRICSEEVKTETARTELNERRRQDRICATRYPVLLVHGVFFRDYEHLNYWGRIPKELERNGATVFYGEHNSAASVEDSAKELEKKILTIVHENGCEKVNVIAHSKGGLDTRAAIAETAAGQYIASLTTINTPHRGCEFAEYFLEKIPEKQQESLAAKYNTVAAKLGDTDPDFLSAVYDLTASKCAAMNERVKDSPDVYYQWVGSIQKKAVSGKFPLNFTYHIVNHFDGRNDGLVGENSFAWGEKYAFLENTEGTRGISHADMIDLNRENIKGFDVREFYIQLVASLKRRGF